MAEANKLGYEVGVRINIDVLNAQQQLFLTLRDLALARYNTNGSVDTSFGTGGQVAIVFNGGMQDAAQGLALRARGLERDDRDLSRLGEAGQHELAAVGWIKPFPASLERR